ncbi:MAG: PQQ-binding-like beta-propeller repeat protein [Candidatus Sabulitectum sp.]|nr:PQQ-binding-like beta-propeller repeat protein [Candidatus Sabulitectum sp.]
MFITFFLIATVLSSTGVTITEPVDGETYSGDWLPVRAIVENENVIPDSVLYVLNGSSSVAVPRLNTDWYTYMANDCHTGYSESPAPVENTILWTAPVTGNHHEFPTPVVVNGIVYYPQDSSGDSLYALNAATGEVLWTYRTGYTDDAVTVKNGLLFTASDSLWCLDALTGERIWANGEATCAASTPAVHNGSVFSCSNIYSSNTSTLYSLDTETGAVNWSSTVSGYVGSCLTVWNDMVFMPTWYGPLYAFDINTGAEIWQNNDSPGGYWDSSPVIVEGFLYILGDDSKARALDPLSGASVWETLITPGTYLSATPAFHNDRLYFGDQVNSFHCLEAGAGSFVWSLPGVLHGSPGVADGIVFYGEGSNYYDETAHVYALSCETGEVIWSYETVSGPYGIVSSPSITDGVVYIAGTDWNLYAFGTGMKYTYLDELYGQIGSNELIITSYFNGSPAAADTITFTVSGTGISPRPSRTFNLVAGPNPFTVSATISFELPYGGNTSVSIFDLAGREVATLVNGEMVHGVHSVQWNGEEIAAGLYICRIESGGVVETIGLCLLK